MATKNKKSKAGSAAVQSKAFAVHQNPKTLKDNMHTQPPQRNCSTELPCKSLYKPSIGSASRPHQLPFSEARLPPLCDSIRDEASAMH